MRATGDTRPATNEKLAEYCRQYCKHIKATGHPGLETRRSFNGPFRHFRASRAPQSLESGSPMARCKLIVEITVQPTILRPMPVTSNSQPRLSFPGKHEDQRSLTLSLRNLPVLVEESIFLFRWNEVKAVPLVKADGPLSGGPCTD